jgi:hypothetical protein
MDVKMQKGICCQQQDWAVSSSDRQQLFNILVPMESFSQMMPISSIEALSVHPHLQYLSIE